MTTRTISSRELNQDIGGAKRAASDGPVVITDRGRPAHVLMTIETYRRLTGATGSLVDALAMPGLSDVAFDPPRVSIAGREAGLE
jgi:prevent-host-death family protein